MSKHTDLLRLYASTVGRYQAVAASSAEASSEGLYQGISVERIWMDISRDDAAHLNMHLADAVLKVWPSLRGQLLALTKSEMDQARAALHAHEREIGLPEATA